MHTSRRGFVTGSLTSVFALGATSSMPHAADNLEENDKPDCLDYGLSFICNTAAFNAVRFWIESRTTLIDDKHQESWTFYQCGSCKSENTFGEKDLLYKDNYDFLPIFGGKQVEDLLVFRRPVGLSERYRDIKKSQEVWGEPVLKLRKGKRVRELHTWDDIRDATAAAVPIVTRTEICNDETQLRAIIECPVKTMNISLERQMYQVDTGPIAFPDLSKRFEPAIECLSLAFVVFNAAHFADFVVEQPTAVMQDDEELCQVYHYSNPFSLPAGNRVFAVQPPE